MRPNAKTPKRKPTSAVPWTSVRALMPPSYFRAPPAPAKMLREPINPALVQILLRSMASARVARQLSCSVSSVRRLRDYADGRWG